MTVGTVHVALLGNRNPQVKNRTPTIVVDH
jgi:hypothetical protein